MIWLSKNYYNVYFSSLVDRVLRISHRLWVGVILHARCVRRTSYGFHWIYLFLGHNGQGLGIFGWWVACGWPVLNRVYVKSFYLQWCTAGRALPWKSDAVVSETSSQGSCAVVLKKTAYRDVAELVKAHALGAWDRGFESRYPDHPIY